MHAAAKIPRQKSPKEAAVSLVSCQLNWPVPKTRRIIWALNKKKKRETGMIEKAIWRKLKEKWSKNSCLAPLTQALDKNGKEATANEAPTIPMGRYWILLAKLKMAMEPTANVEAMAVMTIKFKL